MTMTRKEFLRSMLGAGVGVVGVAAVASCGDDGGSGQIDAPQVAACTTPTSAIQNNHGHTVTVALADVNAAVDKTYDISGSAAHSHMVTLTGAQFTQIKNGQTLTITSTAGGGHTHPVTFMCVS